MRRATEKIHYPEDGGSPVLWQNEIPCTRWQAQVKVQLLAKRKGAEAKPKCRNNRKEGTDICGQTQVARGFAF
jgi:hypothetical protein